MSEVDSSEADWLMADSKSFDPVAEPWKADRMRPVKSCQNRRTR
jgi:hypothetical protein